MVCLERPEGEMSAFPLCNTLWTLLNDLSRRQLAVVMHSVSVFLKPSVTWVQESHLNVNNLAFSLKSGLGYRQHMLLI